MNSKQWEEIAEDGIAPIANRGYYRDVEAAFRTMLSRVRELEAENARLKEEVEYNASHYEAALANWNECMKGIDRLKEENKRMKDEVQRWIDATRISHVYHRCDYQSPCELCLLMNPNWKPAKRRRAFTTSREGNDR